MNVNQFNQDIEKCLVHLKDELAQIRTGRATPELLENVRVDAYGMQNPIKNIATVAVVDAQCLVVQPWDKALINAINKGIMAANLGYSPIEEADQVRVRIPDLSKERRMEYVKLMKERVEAARVAVRHVRQNTMKQIDEEVKGGVSEDEGKRLKAEVEADVKNANDEIEELRDKKEKELMTV